MIITETLKRRFVKDTNLPIKIFDEPYFSHFLDLYEEHFQARTLWEMFLKELEKYEHESDYSQEYNRVKDAAINYLAENSVMQYFSHVEDMNKFNIKNTGLPASTVFKETLVGHTLLSIDMKRANFSALRHYNSAIVGEKDSYEEFLGMFTDSEYMKRSKYIRQVIFGNQNPRRQTKYEQYLMDLVLTKFLEAELFNASMVVYFGTDEIVFDISEVAGHKDLIPVVNQVLEWADQNNIRIRGEYYRLLRIRGTAGYMKDFVYPTADKDFEIKSASGIEMPFIIRSLKNESPEDMDGIFAYEGLMAKLVEPIRVYFSNKPKTEETSEYRINHCRHCCF